MILLFIATNKLFLVRHALVSAIFNLNATVNTFSNLVIVYSIHYSSFENIVYVKQSIRDIDNASNGNGHASNLEKYLEQYFAHTHHLNIVIDHLKLHKMNITDSAISSDLWSLTEILRSTVALHSTYIDK